jgi:cob(I)alamin adenosyltransferase
MFIQIIQGKCSREDEMRAAIDRWQAELEPGTEGWLGGTYGFTDEATARANESREMPAEMRERMEQMQDQMHDVEYMDLHRPWFASHRER